MPIWETIAQHDAAKKAAAAQIKAAEMGIAEQRRQFSAATELARPYVETGETALREQLRLLGMGPSDEDMAARKAGLNNIHPSEIANGKITDEYGNPIRSYGDFAEYRKRVESYQPGQGSPAEAMARDPNFLAMAQQGENALLQNASATGGLRGGNTQAALAEFRPAMLQQMLQQKFANLSGLSGMGQASAAGQAASGMQMAGAIGGLQGDIGAARAGRDMAIAQIWGDPLGLKRRVGLATSVIGSIYGGGGGGGGGG